MAFPLKITNLATFNAEGNQYGDVGPFSNGPTNRYAILQDATNFLLRAFKSADKGNTWNEIDAAHHPSYSNDVPNPRFFGFYAVARDQNTLITKLYVVYFNTAQVVTMIPFDMTADLWGAAVPSTLGYTTPAVGTADIAGFSAVHRGVDNNLIVGFTPVQSVSGNDRPAIAKLAIGSGTWDGAWTAVGQTDTNANDGNWEIVGMCRGVSNSVHIFLGQLRSPAQNSALWNQVLHSDNSLTPFNGNLVFQETNADLLVQFTRPVQYQSEVVIGFVRFTARPAQNLAFTACRAISGDAPVWNITNITTGLTTSALTSLPGMCFAVDAGTLFFFFLIATLGGGNSTTCAYVTNTGPTQPWSAITNIATLPNVDFFTGTGAFFGASSVGSLGLSFPFFVGGVTFQHSYFEFGNPVAAAAGFGVSGSGASLGLSGTVGYGLAPGQGQGTLGGCGPRPPSAVLRSLRSLCNKADLLPFLRRSYCDPLETQRNKIKLVEKIRGLR